VALRRIAKDPNATVKQRLRACELQAIIASYIEGHNTPNATVPENRNAKPVIEIQTSPNDLKLRRLLGPCEAEDRRTGLPDAHGSLPTAQNGVTQL
jgi:hypothetical protein